MGLSPRCGTRHHPAFSPQRQMFFRKKLLHSSQTLRAASLGQDRYRRRYWVLPHLGGIFVEGAEGEPGRGSWGWDLPARRGPCVSPPPPALAVAEPAPQEPPEEKASPHVSPVKEEPVDMPIPNRTNCTASRSRGRPRKSKEELSQHCGPRPPPVNGVLEETVPLGQSQHDLSQSAFLSWLSQTQSSLLKDSVLTPDSSPGKGDTGLPPLEAPSDPAEEEEEEESAPEAVEKQGPWFNLLPRTPCDDRAPLATSSAEPSPRAAAQPRTQPRSELPKGSARQVRAWVRPGSGGSCTQAVGTTWRGEPPWGEQGGTLCLGTGHPRAGECHPRGCTPGAQSCCPQPSGLSL